MLIWLLSPFHGGSHAQWAEGYAANSAHRVRIFSLPGRHWKWRMHGAAISLARQCLASSERPDLIIATDMLDLSTFRGLSHRALGTVPHLLYCHENQLTYPWSPDDPDPAQQRDQHYGFINYQSALVADALWFNSAYHQRSFLGALATYLARLPDHQELDLVPEIAAKSQVMPVGLDLKRLDRHTPDPDLRPHAIPHILWNHRWEYDKGPEIFIAALFALKAADFPFRLILLGERYRRHPAIFDEALIRLSDHILYADYATDRAVYAHWLRQADLLPVSARHDFFGVSVVEAIYCGVQPLLPDRLAYPEHVATGDLYSDAAPLAEVIQEAWSGLKGDSEARRARVAVYDWSIMAPRYDAALAQLSL